MNLTQRAALLCKDDYFHHLIGLYDYPQIEREQRAREYICQQCDIKSRAELSSNQAAAEKFTEILRNYDCVVAAKEKGFIE